MLRKLTTTDIPAVLHDRLGSLVRRFSHTDRAEDVLKPDGTPLAVVTGFGPTNAPTAGTLSVMLGIVELQRQLDVPMTVAVSELGAWNCRNVPWPQLVTIRDRMLRFLEAVGFAGETGTLRSHLDYSNLVRAGKVARFLTRQDLLDRRENLLELYDDHGLLGSEIGRTVDTLYTIADILEPVEQRAGRILMVSGLEEAYFTELARLVLTRQAEADSLTLGWQADIGALYFRVLEGLSGYPKMSKSIPASSIHLDMDSEALADRILSSEFDDQPALLSSIELGSGWPDSQIVEAQVAYANQAAKPDLWLEVKAAYLTTFLQFAKQWKGC